jgi:alkane 1-monooxygenase
LPPLWFRVMDKRLMALPHVGGDLDRVNVDERARPSLSREWRRERMAEPAP